MKFVATILVAVALAGACTDDDDDPSTTTTDGSGTTIVIPTVVGQTTTTDLGTSTTKPGVQRMTTPDQASAHLFLAWKANNREEAGEFADAAAVNELFSHPYTGPEPSFEGCEQQVDRYNCGYRSEGSAIIFRVAGSAAAGFRVVAVDFIAD